MSSNFNIIRLWPPLADSAQRAEAAVHQDARTACFYARRTLELLVDWLYATDPDFQKPYENHLASLLAAPSFTRHVPPLIVAKARIIKDLGNQAVHGKRPIRESDGFTAVRELFHVAYWFARTYDRHWDAAHDGLSFNEKLLPPAPTKVAQQSAEQVQKLEAELKARDEKLAEQQRQRADLDAQLVQLREEIAQAKKRAGLIPDPHDYSEAQTRDFFIDLLLREAGWGLRGWKHGEDIEVEVEGMPNTASGGRGKGYVDYVLGGEDGRPLALVEAKRTKKDPRLGQQQAKLYADCLEQRYGRRPVIFYTNGYETWLWDDVLYPPRPVQGFYKKDELELMIERRTSRKNPVQEQIDPGIVERYYQTEAIREMARHLQQGYRKGLIVMATGAGKTRTVIALVDLLLRSNWVKRVLFLADRTALVEQAHGVFKKFLPACSPVNLLADKNTEGRVYVSTYPTMLNLIEEARSATAEVRRFGVGHFDLVIIDEAHRSVYQKYRAIFEYFDSMLIGLTATPRDEVDRDTYRLFELQPGLPTYGYELELAVKDGFLVPFKAVSVPLKFQREGIRYDDLSEDEKTQWDALEWDEEGDPPTEVNAEAINKWLFNKDTVDKVLAHLMEHGLKVAGGDRLGKTIIFARNKDHARFIEDRFNLHYPHLKGSFARVIDHYEPYAQSLLKEFSLPEKPPHIAISVDMLDTGIDIPEVVNLVFFKLVRSKTKFFQMIGRGTRLCRDLFGPGQDKQFFYIFDFCQNLEFFNQNPVGIEGTAPKSLSALLFLSRLELHKTLEPLATSDGHTGLQTLRTDVADLLHEQVAAMNVDNFLVRPKRRVVERFAQRGQWNDLKPQDYAEAGDELATLPTELPAEDETAKRFDLLVLRLQLAVLNQDISFKRLRDQVREIASQLAEKKDIPMVAVELPLILDLDTDEWWQNVTLPMLEDVRRKIRGLVKFIDKQGRRVIITDFEDQIGDGTTVDIAGLGQAIDAATYKRKMLQFLERHRTHISLHRLHENEPLTKADIAELEKLLFNSSELGSKADFEKAYGPQPELGKFLRGLVGLDRKAAKKAFGDYLNESRFNARQIRFVSYIIDHLTKAGTMDPKLLYESPYTDLSPNGLDDLFPNADANRIISIIEYINRNAAVADGKRMG